MTLKLPLRQRALRCITTLGLTAALVACGGGDFVESLVRLISARFVPAGLLLTAGATDTLQLEISCDRDGLNTAFGRLGVFVKLDPDGVLPAYGLTVTPTSGGAVDAEGFRHYDCVGPTPDPEVLITRITVQVTASATAAPATSVLVANVKVEPLSVGQGSKDGTSAEVPITVSATGGELGTNLLINPDFSVPVQLGALPTAASNWRGDLSAAVRGERGIVPRSGLAMLSFLATSTISSTNTVSSQQWQLVDVSRFAESIAAGQLRADAGVWFNRVVGDATTDRRFDLRLIAFSGTLSEMPTRYVAGTWLAQQTTTVTSSGNLWQQANAGFTLPAGTTCVLVEIYAYEDVVNDGETAEFAGHYADDASLVLTLN